MLEDLTVRERELFDLLLTGVPAKEIAHKLNISHHTVALQITCKATVRLHCRYSTLESTNSLPLPRRIFSFGGGNDKCFPGGLNDVKAVLHGKFFFIVVKNHTGNSAQ